MSQPKPNEIYLLIYDQRRKKSNCIPFDLLGGFLPSRPCAQSSVPTHSPRSLGQEDRHSPCSLWRGGGGGFPMAEGGAEARRGSAQRAPSQLRLDNNSAEASNEYKTKTIINDSLLFFPGRLGFQSTRRCKSSGGPKKSLASRFSSLGRSPHILIPLPFLPAFLSFLSPQNVQMGVCYPIRLHGMLSGASKAFMLPLQQGLPEWLCPALGQLPRMRKLGEILVELDPLS